MQVLAYEANIEAAVLAQDSGVVPLPEDYTQFIPKVLLLLARHRSQTAIRCGREISHTCCPDFPKSILRAEGSWTCPPAVEYTLSHTIPLMFVR